MQDGEDAIWSAVISQAWRDHFDNPPDMTPQEIKDAKSFLFDKTGEWEESRRTVCIAAGMCPDDLRDMAIRHLAVAA